MNSPTLQDSTPDRSWQQANEARMRRNALHWAESLDSTLLTEEWEDYYVAVTLEGTRLILWMLDAEVANTDWIQSALDLAQPLRLQSSYTQAMVLSLLWQPHPQKVFLSGLGGGCLATVLHHHLTWANFVCVEIAPPIAAAATKYFGFQPDERMSLVVNDVRNFLETDKSQYDVMLLDVFCDHGVTPSRATESEFLHVCQSRIAERGLLAMNLGDKDPAFENVVIALGQLFSTVYLCRGRGNTSVPRAQLLEGAAMLAQRHNFLFALPPWISRRTAASAYFLSLNRPAHSRPASVGRGRNAGNSDHFATKTSSLTCNRGYPA